MQNTLEILNQLQNGTLSLEEAFAMAASAHNVDAVDADGKTVARLDISRRARCGFPEFIYGAGKSVGEILAIVPRLQAAGENVLATRLADEAMDALQAKYPEAKTDRRARCFLLAAPNRAKRGNVIVLTAGTSDLPAATEALMTLEACDCTASLISDAGIAGLHRLLGVVHRLRCADAVIAAAGMEGALPSVVAGLVPVPVVALPTSVGYGAGLQGMTPLLAMLSSCASGVTVVNIDNGFGAACAAARIVNAKY